MSKKSAELKLNSLPTGGVDAATSPYYRRLLSAGYKGELQGALGGASLYGTIGLAIGGIVAAGALLFGAPLAAPFTLMGLIGGTGALVGATSFGSIGSTAAINAESADLLEKRRYLLDRYNELPDGPEGDREAAEIKKQLVSLHADPVNKPPFFHWKTVALCAAVGAVIALAIFNPLMAPLLGEGALAMLHGSVLAAAGPAAAAAVGAGIGALGGAVVGIDRFYIRKWFDVTEGAVHSTTHNESALKERSQLDSLIEQAHEQDALTKQNLVEQRQQFAPLGTVTTRTVAEAPATSPTTASIPQLNTASDKPDTRITAATVPERLMAQHAMDVSL